jgi:hypothetical protein
MAVLVTEETPLLMPNLDTGYDPVPLESVFLPQTLIFLSV